MELADGIAELVGPAEHGDDFAGFAVVGDGWDFQNVGQHELGVAVLGIFFKQFVQDLAGFGTELVEEIFFVPLEAVRAFAAGAERRLADEVFADGNDAAVRDGALLRDGVRLVVPADGLQPGDDELAAGVGLIQQMAAWDMFWIVGTHFVPHVQLFLMRLIGRTLPAFLCGSKFKIQSLKFGK